MSDDSTSNGNEKRSAFLARATGRGPSYPALSLEEAVGKAKEFWVAAKRGAAPVAAVAKHWGYSETSSSGKTAVAALLQFGLLQSEGSLHSRTVKLTNLGLDIVLDHETSARRASALQEAVRAPKLYADILAKWPPHELPIDSMLRYYLIREKSFNEVSVGSFIKDFRASVAFAGLAIPPTMSPESTMIEELETDSESMSMSAALTEAAASARSLPYGLQSPETVSDGDIVQAAQASLVRVKALLGADEQQWMHGTLSRGTAYRLLGTGEMTAKDLGKLVKLLEAQKAVLEDDDEDDRR